MRKKVQLFIDGTNLYAAQFELFGPSRYLCFPAFIEQIEKKLDIKFDKIYFYASYSPHPPSPTIKQKQFLKNEGRFYNSVREQDKVVFFKGFRSKASGKEKGVDVKIALDIQSMAYENRFHRAFLISGDSDLLQVVIAIKKLGKSIHLINLMNKVMYKAIYETIIYLIYDKNSSIRPNLLDKENLRLMKVKYKDMTSRVR